MEKSDTIQLAKDFVSTGFDQGFHCAVDIVRALVPTMENERDKFVMENLAKVLTENAKREKWLFFSRVTFEADESGIVTLKQK